MVITRKYTLYNTIAAGLNAFVGEVFVPREFFPVALKRVELTISSTTKIYQCSGLLVLPNRGCDLASSLVDITSDTADRIVFSDKKPTVISDKSLVISSNADINYEVICVLDSISVGGEEFYITITADYETLTN